MKPPQAPCDAALEVTQITVGRFKVSLTGLQEALEEARSLKGRPEAEIAQTLLEKLKPRNYIPPPALIVNGRVKIAGRIPTRPALELWFTEARLDSRG